VTLRLLLAEYQALIAATEDHLDHLPASVRLRPMTRTLADVVDHARTIAAQATAENPAEED